MPKVGPLRECEEGWRLLRAVSAGCVGLFDTVVEAILGQVRPALAHDGSPAGHG